MFVFCFRLHICDFMPLSIGLLFCRFRYHTCRSFITNDYGVIFFLSPYECLAVALKFCRQSKPTSFDIDAHTYVCPKRFGKSVEFTTHPFINGLDGEDRKSKTVAIPFSFILIERLSSKCLDFRHKKCRCYRPSLWKSNADDGWLADWLNCWRQWLAGGSSTKKAVQAKCRRFELLWLSVAHTHTRAPFYFCSISQKHNNEHEFELHSTIRLMALLDVFLYQFPIKEKVERNTNAGTHFMLLRTFLLATGPPCFRGGVSIKFMNIIVNVCKA